ncbi:MAG: 50S ribosomal protein L20 [Firmicutes bacterium]|jgi:large subunit ribosomal protein L20|nr:50S ribosomal protein L20 [Bacillota bacterium]
MARVKTGVVTRRRHKRILKMARGYRGSRHRLFRPANEAVLHSLWYAYQHRKKRKGDFRRLWIVRINAAARSEGMSYSSLIHGLKKAGIELNRKMLAELAVRDADRFRQLVGVAKAQL